MVYQPQTHARPHEPSQREIEASDAEVQRFLDDPEAEDVDWETYAAGYKWGPDFMRYFNEALAANGERTDGVYGDLGLEAWPEARVVDCPLARRLDGALGRAADARTRKICADHAARVEALLRDFVARYEPAPAAAADPPPASAAAMSVDDPHSAPFTPHAPRRSQLDPVSTDSEEDEDDAIAPRGLGAFDGYGSRDDDDDADSGGGDDWSAPAASPDARERGFDRDDYSAEDDLCKGVRRMSTTPQKAPEPRAPFRHYSYRDADERPPAWQRKSAF